MNGILQGTTPRLVITIPYVETANTYGTTVTIG